MLKTLIAAFLAFAGLAFAPAAALGQAAPTNIFAGQLAAGTNSTFQPIGSCSVGQVAIVWVMTNQGSTTGITSLTGDANTWAAGTTTSASSYKVRGFVAKLSAAVTPASTYAVNLPNAASAPFVVMDCFTGGTDAGTTEGGNSGGSGGTSSPGSIIPASGLAPSYRSVAAAFSNGATAAAPTTGAWTVSGSIISGVVGLVTYWDFTAAAPAVKPWGQSTSGATINLQGYREIDSLPRSKCGSFSFSFC